MNPRKRTTRALYKYRWCQDLTRRQIDLFGAARAYHSTADQLDASIVDRVFHDPRYAKLTMVQRGCLAGYRAALYDELWRTAVVWRLGPVEGPLSEAQQDTEWSSDVTGTLSRLCREPGQLYGGHFWKGTDKMFTPYDTTNA